MAEVTFFGTGANGFPSPDTQILPGNLPSSAEVQTYSTPTNTSRTLPATVSEILSPSLMPAPEFTEVEIVAGRAVTPIPASTSPNVNEVIFAVATGAAPTLYVRRYALDVVTGEMVGDRRADLDLMSQFDLSKFNGKMITFLAPTGASGLPQLYKGRQFSIVGVVESGNDAFLEISPNPGINPTNLDRFTIGGLDDILRRSPVLEIILE